jgi:hypothetical protein
MLNRKLEHSFDAKRGGRKNFTLFGLILLTSLLLIGCKKDPKLSFIQGMWFYKDAHLANLPGESAQETTWQFDHGYFSVDTCCFVKAYYSGYYSVSERKENELILNLFNLQGQVGDIVLRRDDTMSATITIDQEQNAIYIDHAGPYSKASP